MRRWKLRWLLALVGLAVLLAASAIVLLSGRDDAPVEKIERVTKGMTRAEVEAILGSPGTYHTVMPLYPPGTTEWWVQGSTLYMVQFDGRGRVEYRSFSSREREHRMTLVDEFRRLWHRWFP